MKSLVRKRETYEQISPEEFRVYLRGLDWNREKSSEGEYSVWSYEGLETLLVLPENRDYRDYAQRMFDALETVARAEQRSALQICSDILNVYSDVLKIRISENDADEGSLPFSFGATLFSATKDLLLAAACSAEKPRAFHSNRKPDTAQQFLRNARLGQTERGSFVLTVFAKVDPALHRQIDLIDSEYIEGEQPFARQVTLKLMQGLSALSKATEESKSSSNIAPFESAVTEGVSSNLCEALAKMGGEEEQYDLEFSTRWSPGRPVPKKCVPGNVQLQRSSYPIIREAARVLKERAPREEFHFRGYVLRLEREEHSDHGTVWVSGIVDDQHRKVKIDLPDQKYSEAIRAHSEEREVVCRGRLVLEGRTHSLRDLDEWRIVND